MPEPTAIVYPLEDIAEFWAEAAKAQPAERIIDPISYLDWRVAVEVNQSDDGNEWRDVPVGKVRVVFYREVSDEEKD